MMLGFIEWRFAATVGGIAIFEGGVRHVFLSCLRTIE
jgi:hypothetical protein